jgi:hypothetical protein
MQDLSLWQFMPCMTDIYSWITMQPFSLRVRPPACPTHSFICFSRLPVPSVSPWPLASSVAAFMLHHTRASAREYSVAKKHAARRRLNHLNDSTQLH